MTSPAPQLPWRADLLAGLTVAFVGMPQCLAYAMMAGLPPAYGLVTAAVPAFVAALLGRSAQIVTGPTNTTGLLILGALAPLLAHHGLIGPSGLAAVALLTLMAGLFRLAFVLLGGATIVRFLPEPVLVGFTAGAGLLIAVMQLDEALGLPGVAGAGLWGEILGVQKHLQSGHAPAWPALLLTTFTVGATLAGKRYLPRMPMALMVLVGATLLAWAAGLNASTGLALVADRSTLPDSWPPFALPSLDLELIRRFLFPALGISLLGTLELLVTARARGEQPDMRREITAQGVANLVGCVVGAFPASASLTRSVLLRLSGARSRLAAASAALWVLPVLLLIPHALGFIPLASLAGILLATALGMVDLQRIRRMWHASRETRVLVTSTFLSTLVLPLEWAIITGTGLAMLWYLSGTLHPRLTIYIAGEAGTLEALEEHVEPALVVVEISGNVHFAASVGLAGEINTLIPKSARRVVVDMSHAHQARFGCLEALESLHTRLEGEGRELRLAGVSKSFCTFVEKARSNLHITPATEQPGASVQQALRD
ncbi:MAG: SulP family inorganic anion transporter [Deltaproteobacteria bacterium]|nr:SulP family inorganic anion transporter [Deltaproteobacteria bacterium]